MYRFIFMLPNVSVDRFGFCASAQKQIRSNAWFSAPQISIGTARRSRSLRHLRVSLPPIPPSHLLHDSDFVGSNSHVEPQNRPCNAARPHGDLVAVQALCACRRLRRCGRGDFIPSALAVNPFFSPSSRAPYLGAGNVSPHRIPNPPRVRNTVKAIVRHYFTSSNVGVLNVMRFPDTSPAMISYLQGRLCFSH